MKKGEFVLAVVVCLFSVFAAKAQPSVTVNEEKSSVVINEKTADVLLVLQNRRNGFDGKITLELLDEENRVRSNASQSHKIKKGENQFKVSLPLADLIKNADDKIAWYRLRYQIGVASGIISLSELIEDIFELRVIATDNLFSGMIYRSRIRAINPFNEQAVKNVKIRAELELDLKSETEEKLKLTADGETDSEGVAVVDFRIPTEARLDGDGGIKIIGKKGGIVREAAEELNALSDDYSFLILTDKPIYQPEQTLNLRGILLKGAEAKTVTAGGEVEFRIEDEDDTVLFRETIKTSEFGIAAISWTIPESAKLGNYSISVRHDGEQIGYQSVKVSRYDLPNFAVVAKPDKTFYLPGEKQAEIEIRADYLFGKPVTKGKVRVVEENSREWNWKNQKYDIDEGEIREGETDVEGKFIARFDLSEAHKDLQDNDWRKYRDINFAAYFTDLTTNKTEQRRFDLRVSKEAIHVYFIGKRSGGNPALPVDAFVSTFYADGSPAVCDVEVYGSEEDEDKFRILQRLKTNSFGAGKVGFKRPKFEDADTDLDLKIVAKDKNGKAGTFEDEIYFEDEDVLRVKTDKSIYKPGENVKVKIDSNLKTGLIYVDVVKGWSVIDSYFLNLKNGKAALNIPFQENFQGELKIAAFHEDEDEEMIHAVRGIIFPAPQNLRLEANFEKASYKPGEEAKVNFSVLDTIGQAIESALGVVVFDKAVEERAKTDSDFGGMFKNFYGWLGYGGAFGSVNVKDLNELDLSKPIPDELQLVADVILYDSYYQPNMFHSRDFQTDAKSVYAEQFKKQFDPIEKILNETYQKQNFRHPADETELNKILAENSLNLNILRDPWEKSYRPFFEINKTQRILKFVSAGADKKFDTSDDFAVSSLSFTYFAPMGNRINAAVKNYYERTGKFIRDRETLFAELGVTELFDPFGHPYHIDFGVAGRNYLINVRSTGKDGVYEKYYYQGDDFAVWSNQIDYFAATEAKINEVLQKLKPIPEDEKELIALLSKNGVEFEQIRDGFGREIYLTKQRFSRFTDKVVIENVSQYGEEQTTQKTMITPVTQEILQFTIRSKGADGSTATSDDFTLAQFLFVISEQTKDDEKPQIKNTAFISGTGSISGVITDATGAVVPAATVTATNEESKQVRSVMADSDGKYLFANLAAGNYSIKVEASGFQISVRSNVPIKANTTTKVDFVLEAGSVSSVVEVTASAESINTTNSSISASQISSLPLNARNALELVKLQPGAAKNQGEDFDTETSQKSTPRLREYFPETLVWSPELITDKNGRAELKFKMADNITTWKLYTIASTKNGKIGVAEKEVTAFQNFFVDLEPPKFLTEGDEIFLPAQIRNYTEAKQNVEVSMGKSDWFSFINSDRRQIEVAPNASENAVFGFRADAVVKDGRQKVTAIAKTDSDAIEKTVNVRPNGQEVVRAESKLFRESAAFEINFPAKILPETNRAELKIYPNLFSHVAESVEGLLQRPYGCGEQTVSSTYPNLMILKFTKEDSKLRRTALKNLQKGYERLLGYQTASGGFSYWGGRDEADIALTAYSIRFLNDAREFIEIDEESIKKATGWLIAQQRADGSFTKKYYFETTEDVNRTKLFTSYIARILAMIEDENTTEKAESALQKALAYLKTRNAEIDEPYALALFGLASLDAGNLQDAQKTADKLEKMAIVEGNAVYWNLETNTPFYGWGTAGRIETTALVVQLLTKIQKRKTVESNDKELISKGTQFLLKNKDRYGVWYSTQTTINVLDAFLAALGNETEKSGNHTIQIFLNGANLQTVEVLPDQITPVILDLNGKINSAANRLEIKSSTTSSIMAQIVAGHYIDWRDAEISNRNVNQSRQIRLEYRCDKPNAAIMQDINCAVEAERVGFKGYGMLLAEIGIPPGADVSRESLQAAMEADWSLSRYDILPDRIIFYMWSKAGGTKFNFKFRPRYAINAQTPSSMIYDYYNEEAKATVAPLKFQIK